MPCDVVGFSWVGAPLSHILSRNRTIADNFSTSLLNLQSSLVLFSVSKSTVMMPSNRLFSRVLFAVLLFTGGTNVLAQEEMEEVPSQQRRELWDFFSFVSLLARLGPPCTRRDGTKDWGPRNGPRWNDCLSDSETAYPTETMYPQDGEESENVSQMNSYVSNADTDVYGGQGTAGGGMFNNSTQGLNLWMGLAAGSILSALVAIHLGQKKENRGGKHGMCGAIMRRKGAVSAFAEGVFPSRGKEVEMKPSRPEYRLDMSPQGGEAV